MKVVMQAGRPRLEMQDDAEALKASDTVTVKLKPYHGAVLVPAP